MHWKAFSLQNHNTISKDNQTYGIKSKHSPLHFRTLNDCHIITKHAMAEKEHQQFSGQMALKSPSRQTRKSYTSQMLNLSLTIRSHKPFMKPNNKILYIH